MGVLSFSLIINIQEILKKKIWDFWFLKFTLPKSYNYYWYYGLYPLGAIQFFRLWFSCPSQKLLFFFSFPLLYFILSAELHLHVDSKGYLINTLCVLNIISTFLFLFDMHFFRHDINEIVSKVALYTINLDMHIILTKLG